MFTTLTAAALVHPWVGGFGVLFVIGHVIGFLLILGLIFAIARGRRRMWARGGDGPWGQAGWGHGYGHAWAQTQAARTAEATLAERFAQGDIDEKEYRARLEVLRASVPQPPMPPSK